VRSNVHLLNFWTIMATEKTLDPTLTKILQSVWCDELQTNLVDGGLVDSAVIDGDGAAQVTLKFPFAAQTTHPDIVQRATTALRGLPEPKNVRISCSTAIAPHAAQVGVERVVSVRNMIAVASGKGGVGKSTTTVNLALALAQEGAKVGVLDADIYGPSIPTMLGITGRPESEDGTMIEPKEGHGLQVSSIGFLIDKDDAMIWRGPMVTQALEQLLRQTKWRDLDYLLIDMPPGTGDIHLTLAQRVPITGALIVTTPQEVALIDARKGLRMFQKVSVPVLGLIENMNLHICSSCGHHEHIFGHGGAQALSQELQVPFLGSLPLEMRIRQDADSGRPTVVSDPDSEVSAVYRTLARQVSVAISRMKADMSGKFPKIVVQAT
jgi:ATP-binding protein involved in chromosome partitioning